MIDRWARKSGLNTSSVLRAMFYALQGSVEDVIGKYKAKENFKRIDR
jgi:pyruvate-formate lyase